MNYLLDKLKEDLKDTFSRDLCIHGDGWLQLLKRELEDLGVDVTSPYQKNLQIKEMYEEHAWNKPEKKKKKLTCRDVYVFC